jgi:hypothetical protein
MRIVRVESCTPSRRVPISTHVHLYSYALILRRNHASALSVSPFDLLPATCADDVHYIRIPAFVRVHAVVGCGGSA